MAVINLPLEPHGIEYECAPESAVIALKLVDTKSSSNRINKMWLGFIRN